MRWFNWLPLFLALNARSFVAAAAPSLCEEETCHCDAFTRVICNCTPENEIILRPNGSYRVPQLTTSIILNGCGHVHFLADSVRNLVQLRSIELHNVAYVIIGDGALVWTPYDGQHDLDRGIKIIINNSTINEISSHAIKGRVDEILLSNNRIHRIQPFAFTSLSGVKNIEFTNNIFDTIEPQAFKKFTTENFIINGGTIKTIPSRFLSDMEVTNVFRLSNLQIDRIYSLAFLISSPKRIFVENNIVETLEGDAFHGTVRGPIVFRHNIITNLEKGAFLGFAVKNIHATPLPDLWITNDTVTNLTPESLHYNRTAVTFRVDGLHFNEPCSCDLAIEWAHVGLNKGYITCWDEIEQFRSMLITYEAVGCVNYKKTKSNFWIYVIVGLVLVAFTAAAIIFFVIKREIEKRKHRLVMPEETTYKQAEFHLVLEQTDLLTTDL